ncbi:MAG: DnaJ domain-containing protein [Nitrososphaeraceae archaeon]
MDAYSYYEILNVSVDATEVEIKKSYRTLVKKYHPDKNRKNKYDDEIIKKLNAAFEILSDKKKRSAYDKLQEKQLNSSTIVKNNSNTDQFQNYKSDHNSKFFVDINDIHIRKFPKNKLKKNRFNILIEPSLCMAFGSCEILAPQVFYVEKNKIINPKAEVISEIGHDFETILNAAETCPTKAIKIIDRETGRQIFP